MQKKPTKLTENAQSGPNKQTLALHSYMTFENAKVAKIGKGA